MSTPVDWLPWSQSKSGRGSSGVISEQELDARTKQRGEAAAALEAAQTAVKASALSLEFARINAPISGRIGRKLVTVGNLVSSAGDQPTLLTTIVSVDPVHVYFTAAEPTRLRYRNGADSFRTVLDAERRLLEAEDLLAVAETDASLAAVAVYKALGGGWESLVAPQ